MKKRGHSQRQWMAKFFKCGMRCHYCFKPLSLLEGEGVELATKDHLTPTSRGGSDEIKNIVPACTTCNTRKGTMTEEEFQIGIHKAISLCAALNAPYRKMSLAARDEPDIDILRKESESVSWAWRNPA